MSRGAVATLAGIAALGALAAGCGGGGRSPGVASLGPATTGSSNAARSSGSRSGSGGPSSFVRFATCMQQHGIQAQLAPGGNGVSISGGDAGSPQLRTAQQACQKFLPGGGPKPPSPAQAARQLKALLALAACMRTHGYPGFPDPGSQGGFDLGGASGIDPNSSQFQQAMSACQPSGGSGARLRIGIRSGAGA
jgi:hypothetical protein